ncbi:MAG TPA: hypothetical protein VLS89_04650 [Candidatus Nanopelagicales bacterium]|nr:hypothetical protein [Candidatus Nanopelagicales bacterium]
MGRTLALLNVAAILARQGRKVVAVDLDLEAPGFGLSAMTRSPEKRLARGVSELLLERRAGENMNLEADVYSYPVLQPHCGDNLWLMPAGKRAKELADLVPRLYDDPDDPENRLFDLLVAEIQHRLAPDYLFFDSRTGTADIAGVCTLHLPQVVVSVCGLSEQNVAGMAYVLQQMRDFRRQDALPEVATLLVLSPVPRLRDERQGRKESRGGRAMVGGDALLSPEERLLAGRMEEIQRRIVAPMLQELGPGLPSFPHLRPQDLVHELEYDPLVPVTGDLQLTRASRLSEQYRELAMSIARASTTDAELVPMDVPWDGP